MDLSCRKRVGRSAGSPLSLCGVDPMRAAAVRGCSAGLPGARSGSTAPNGTGAAAQRLSLCLRRFISGASEVMPLEGGGSVRRGSGEGGADFTPRRRSCLPAVLADHARIARLFDQSFRDGTTRWRRPDCERADHGPRGRPVRADRASDRSDTTTELKARQGAGSTGAACSVESVSVSRSSARRRP